MSEVKPIKPEEVVKKIKDDFPNYVVEAFNSLIQEKWNETKGRAVVYQEESIQTILKLAESNGTPIERHDIFSNGYLDIEELYRENGWEVEYMKQPYYSNEDDFFVFKKKSGKKK